MTQKILKYLFILVVVVLLLMLLIWWAFQYSSVQTKAANYLTHRLSNKYNTEIKIGRVEIDFFKTLDVQDVLVQDRQKDTLLYAGHLKTDLSVFSLLTKKISIDDIQLEDAYINLYEVDGKPNYDFLLTPPSPNSNPVSKDTTESVSWDIDIDNVEIENTILKYDFSDLYIHSNISSLDVKVEGYDMKEKSVYLRFAELKNSAIEIVQIPDDGDEKDDEPSLFPSLPWELKIKEARIDRSTFALSEKGYQSQKNQLDFKNLGLEITELDVDDFKYYNSISGSFKKMTVRDHSGFAIKKLSGNLDFTPKQLSIKQLNAYLPASRFKGDLVFNYDRYQDFTDFDRSVSSNISIDRGSVKVKDLIPLRDLTSLDLSDFNKNTRLETEGKINIKGKDQFYFRNLNVKLHDALKGQIDGQYRMEEGMSQSYVEAKIGKGYFSPSKWQKIHKSTLDPMIVEQGDFYVEGSLSGKLDELSLNNIIGKTNFGTRLNASGKVNGLVDGVLSYDMDINELSIPIRNVNTAELPVELKRLGNLTYKGKLKGTKTFFDIDGGLNTDHGQINGDIVLDFDNNYDQLTYKGRVDVNQLSLHRIMEDPTYGIVDVDVVVDGSGMSLETLNASVKGKINDFAYKEKRYQNIDVDGIVDGLGYNGKIKVNDKDIKLDYDGRLAFNNNAPELDFTMNLDSINLASLNMGIEAYILSGQVKSNLKGQNINDIVGDLVISDYRIQKDGKILTSPDAIHLKVMANADKTRSAIIRSPYGDATLKGNMKNDEVIDALKRIFNAYFEIPGYQPQSMDGRQRFDISLVTKDINPLLDFYDQEFSMKKAVIDGEMDTQNEVIKLKGQIDSLAYKGYWTETTEINVDGENTQMLFSAKFNNTHDKNGIASEVSLINGDIYDKIMNVFVDIREQKDDSVLEVAAQLVQENGEIVVNVGESMTINEDEWSISKNNDIRIGSGKFVIDNLNIFKDKQGLNISTEGDDLKVSFDDFQISEILNLIGRDEYKYTGAINGDFVANQLLGNRFFTTDLKIDSLAFENKLIGKLKVRGKEIKSKNDVNLGFDLVGPENDAIGNLTYNIDSKMMDGYMEAGQMEMRLIDPYLSEIISDSEGHIYGDFKIKGTLKNPDVSGNLLFDNASTVVNFNQTRYKIKKNKIFFNKHLIEFDDVLLYDSSDKEAVLSGAIFHNSFRNMRLDLKADAKGVQFLNTTVNDNPLFYGKVYLDATMQIQGPTDNIKLYANATAVNNSYLALSPFSDVEQIIKDDFIVYGNPDSLKINKKTDDFVKEDAYPLDVDMNLIVNEDSKFEFIVDPIKGDKLQAFGNANLNLQLKKEGDILLNGKYTAKSGFYSFTYGLIEKRFAIDEGGTVSFEGDPLEAKLDIDAIYKTRANLYDLVQSEVDDTKTSRYKKRSDVNVFLSLRGQILQPKITLDIQLPDKTAALYEEAEQKLVTLRTNANQLNNQVFGLLLFDNFVISDNVVTSDFSSVGENFVLGSVSDLLSSQLNKIASGLIKGVELNIDVNNYASKYSENAGVVTELDVGVTKRLLDDRLTLKAGGNFNLESSSAQSEFSSLAGDFIIEYVLNERGNYILKVYNSSDYNVLIDQNTRKSGIGIIVKKNLD